MVDKQVRAQYTREFTYGRCVAVSQWRKWPMCWVFPRPAWATGCAWRGKVAWAVLLVMTRSPRSQQSRWRSAGCIQRWATSAPCSMSSAGTRHSVKRPRRPWAKSCTKQGQDQAACSQARRSQSCCRHRTLFSEPDSGFQPLFCLHCSVFSDEFSKKHSTQSPWGLAQHLFSQKIAASP